MSLLHSHRPSRHNRRCDRFGPTSASRTHPCPSFTSACDAGRSSRALAEFARVAPISSYFATFNVSLELRSLPSAGVTRPPRYCGPLRHPIAPSLTVTGLRLVVTPDHAIGLPVLRALSLCTCCRHYPGAATGVTLRSFPQSCQPSPKGWSGRPAHRPFRGLLSVHSRYGLHTRAVTIFVTRLSEGFSHFVTSMTAPIASGRSDLPGGPCTHWKAPPYHGGHGQEQPLVGGAQFAL